MIPPTGSSAAPFTWPSGSSLPTEPFVHHWPLPAIHPVTDPLAALLAAYPQLRFPLGDHVGDSLDYRRATSSRPGPLLLPAVPGLPFQHSGRFALFLHHGPGGWLPVVGTACREDWRLLVCALRHRNRPLPIHPLTRSLLVNGLPNRARNGGRDCLMLIAPGRYSGVAAATMDLTESEWHRRSRLLRLEHEGCHHLVRRLFPGRPFSLVDELVADCFALIETTGCFQAADFHRFMGTSQDTTAGHHHGRLDAYAGLAELQPPRRRHSLRLLAESGRQLELWSRRTDRPSWSRRRIDFVRAMTTLDLKGLAAPSAADDIDRLAPAP